MAIALVQSNLGGSATGTTTAFVGITTTATGNFLTNTTPGDLLAMVAWGRSSSYRAQALVTLSTPTTAGLTWVAAEVAAGQQNFPGQWESACTIFLATAAAGIASTVSTQLIGQSTAAPTLQAAILVVEYSLYEFSGALGKDQANLAFGNTGGTPTVALSTTAGDLVLMTFQGIGTAPSPMVLAIREEFRPRQRRWGRHNIS